MTKNFSDFFSIIVKNLKILEYQCEDDLHNRLSSRPALKAVLKYRNHPSINKIRNSSQKILSFYFSKVDTNAVLKEIRRLTAKKAVQDPDIPIKGLKENGEFFAEQICHQFNEAFCSSKFPAISKFTNGKPVFKQDTRNLKDIYRPIRILLSLKYLRSSYIGNSLWKQPSQQA